LSNCEDALHSTELPNSNERIFAFIFFEMCKRLRVRNNFSRNKKKYGKNMKPFSLQ